MKKETNKIDLEYEHWKTNCQRIKLIELKIEEAIKKQLITEKEITEIKKIIDLKWIKIAKANPNKSNTIKNNIYFIEEE